MTTGTKSLLFGGHQVILHPIFILIAWIKLYGKFPPWRVLLAIIIHDWGYWGSKKMDDEEGEKHPEWAAEVMDNIFGCSWTYHHEEAPYWPLYDLVKYHSRFLAKRDNRDVSPLCLPDKYGVALMPTWLWVLLVTLSGEGKEYLADIKYETSKIMPPGSRKKGLWDHFKQYKELCDGWVSRETPLCPWSEEE